MNEKKSGQIYKKRLILVFACLFVPQARVEIGEKEENKRKEGKPVKRANEGANARKPEHPRRGSEVQEKIGIVYPPTKIGVRHT